LFVRLFVRLFVCLFVCLFVWMSLAARDDELAPLQKRTQGWTQRKRQKPLEGASWWLVKANLHLTESMWCLKMLEAREEK
jgi:hypothetical protein